MAGEDEYVAGLAEEVAQALMPLLAERLDEMLDARPLLSPREAAERLSVSQSKVYGLIREGLIRVVQVGRQQRIEERELRRFVAASRDDDGGTAGAAVSRRLPGGGGIDGAAVARR